MTIVDPQDEPVVAELVPDDSPASHMPDSVKAAVLGLLLLVGLLISVIVIVIRMERIPITEPIGVAIALAVLYGMLRRHRLAYQWGRSIGLIGAALNAIIAAGHFVAAHAVMRSIGPTGDVAEFANPHADSQVLLAGICAAAAVVQCIVSVSLGFVSAAEYFRLYCPRCGTHEISANDFLFSQAKCDKCGEVWR